MIIRKIQKSDNPFMKSIIQNCLLEFGLPTTGTSFEDADTQNMFKAYQGEKEVFFILEDNGLVVGGGGIKKLNGETEICELQKMYFSPKARGKGYGKILFKKCMDIAKEFGFKKCYLESDPRLTVAISMYEKYGFKHLKESIGDTGHSSCGTWMIKQL